MQIAPVPLMHLLALRHAAPLDDWDVSSMVSRSFDPDQLNQGTPSGMAVEVGQTPEVLGEPSAGC